MSHPLEPTLIPQEQSERRFYNTRSTNKCSRKELTKYEQFWLGLNEVGHLPLSNLGDRHSPLSDFQYFLRSSCLSLHFATPADILEGTRTSVRPPTQIGQVGIKCRFCNDNSDYRRTFPSSIKDIPTDMLEIAEKHLKTCKKMFPNHRRIFNSLYPQPGARDITPSRYEFWCSSANTAFKMRNSVSGGFMFFPPEEHMVTENQTIQLPQVLDDP